MWFYAKQLEKNVHKSIQLIEMEKCKWNYWSGRWTTLLSNYQVISKFNGYWGPVNHDNCCQSQVFVHKNS